MFAAWGSALRALRFEGYASAMVAQRPRIGPAGTLSAHLGEETDGMITALETARRLVLMATLLTLDTILPPSSSDAPRDARRAAPRWIPQDAPRIRTVQPAGMLGGAWRSARRWWLARSHTEPQMRGVPGRVTCPVMRPLREGRSRGRRSPSARAGACPSIRRVPNRRHTTAARKEASKVVVASPVTTHEFAQTVLAESLRWSYAIQRGA